DLRPDRDHAQKQRQRRERGGFFDEGPNHDFLLHRQEQGMNIVHAVFQVKCQRAGMLNAPKRMTGMFRIRSLCPNFNLSRPNLRRSLDQALVLPMLDLGIGLGLVLAGFAFGYGAREVVSYRRRQASIRRHHELGLDYYAPSMAVSGSAFFGSPRTPPASQRGQSRRRPLQARF